MRLAAGPSNLSPVDSAPSRLYAYLSIGALLFLSNSMLLLLPNFLRERGWSSQRIGWAMGCYFVVHLVSRIVSGQIADRYGNVPTALVGTGVACGAGVFYLASLWSTDLVFSARIFQAVGAGMIWTSVLMLLVNSVPAHLKGRMIGYFGLPGLVMWGVGPTVSEWLIYRWGYEATFVSILLIFLVMAWILSRLPRPLAPKGIRRQSFLEELRATLPGLKLILTLPICFGFCASAWQSFLAPTVRLIGEGAVSGFGLGYALGAVMTRLGVSHRVDFGFRRLVGISSLVGYGVSLGLIPHVAVVWHLLILGLLCGMSHGVYFPSLSSIATEQFHSLHSGQALSLYTSASILGMFVGPPVWGAVADITGYPIMFAAAGILLAIGTVTFVLIQWRQMGLRRSSETSTWETL